MRESKAYGQTIYMLIGTPLVLLSGFGLYVRREIRKRDRALEQFEQFEQEASASTPTSDGKTP